MDEFGPWLLLVALAILSVLGMDKVSEILTDEPYKETILSCDTVGYWQHDQIRLLCSVEKPKK